MKQQRGFTLIELMVVLLIIGVILSAGMLSLNNSDSAQTREQAVKIESLFKQAQDQATWRQRAFLVAVDDKGLQAYQWLQGVWQASEQLQSLPWPEHLDVEWQLPLNQPQMLLNVGESKQVALSGWLLLPNGEVQLGQISWQAKNSGYDAPITVLQWNQWLDFELLTDID
ncbi:prepilin-type N-terminal cleavage/methylation domain-containing protein [Thiomicrorhabdus sp. 6S2-11]|uniref:Prepilin-type N-terminal cleavage/methylation domain-containing protein n=1 Tax=Thiomicrorhabdus marina TaxID=2818442 RepID=A0ABS3Q6Q2_9GAMM|nr:prepilin-type N-terminal cleavage/methylation domain-containing protein [Thiomicrorhabdus marina]MBO1928004.1 prepilin-type N-terminal cleavage/methylation domain-containing protein [Thiomicrorhabdus marina]